MTPIGNSGLAVTEKQYVNGDAVLVSYQAIGQVRDALARADERISVLESLLASNRGALSRLLADDLQTCDELTELQKIIWGYHRGLPGDCECDICLEAEQSQRELKALI